MIKFDLIKYAQQGKSNLYLESKIKLKVVSTKFLLACFTSLKESTCKTRKNVLHFTLNCNFSDIKMS